MTQQHCSCGAYLGMGVTQAVAQREGHDCVEWLEGNLRDAEAAVVDLRRRILTIKENGTCSRGHGRYQGDYCADCII